MIDVGKMDIAVASVTATGTVGRGHTPDEWADMLLARLIGIADTAPEPIRTQARAFKQQVAMEILAYMKHCARSERLTVCNQIRDAGEPELADTIWRIG